MIQQKEKGIQENVIKFLDISGLSPFSVTFTYCFEDGGTLALTFWMKEEVEEFLEKIGFKSICDKSGYLILGDNNTVIISGFALIDFYSKVRMHI